MVTQDLLEKLVWVVSLSYAAQVGLADQVAETKGQMVSGDLQCKPFMSICAVS